jgi:N-carbamoyl-L-amino-acid hydrolase
MIFVRNPTGVSHSPEEFVDRGDAEAGAAALADVLAGLLAD